MGGAIPAHRRPPPPHPTPPRNSACRPGCERACRSVRRPTPRQPDAATGDGLDGEELGGWRKRGKPLKSARARAERARKRKRKGKESEGKWAHRREKERESERRDNESGKRE